MAPSRIAPRRTPSHSAAPDRPAPAPDEAVASRPAIDVRAPRERIDVVLRFCQEDDPFVVDWAPPQS